MHRSTLLAAAAVFVATGQAHAQAPAQAPSAPPPQVCPAGGFAPPEYGTFGDNDGVLRAYELASPCISKQLRDAAEAIGMGRNAPLGVKNVTTIRFNAKGKLASDGRLDDVTLDVGVNYIVPGIRLVIDRPAPGAKPSHEIQVFAGDAAWSETAPGVAGAAAPKMAAQRAALLKLTPFGALWSIIEAEGTAKVTTANGMTVISGASPYDGLPVSVTLDAKNLPVSAEVRADGRRYAATFTGYSDKWEPPYLVIFPSQIAWTVDGKPLADLTVTGFKSNPYVVFPAPVRP